MPFVPVPNTAHIAIAYTLAGKVCQNNLYAQRSSGEIEGGMLEDLCLLIETHWTDEVMIWLSQDLGLFEISARDLSIQDGPQFIQPVSPVVPGGVGVESMSNNVAFTIKFLTGLTGRSRRGRNYIPGIPHTVVQNNTVSAETISGLVLAYTNLRNTLASEGWTWVIVSRETGGAQRPVGITTPVLTVGITDDQVDTQRGRLD